MRVMLFTDTLGDVNGVSRFVRNMADASRRTGRRLDVVTSTRMPVPFEPNIFNFAPLAARPMPGYPLLEIVLPPLAGILRHVRASRPDVVHVSTPGPVGIAGLIAARVVRAPVLGVYHTDFPAYAAHLFDDDAVAWIAARATALFYRPFRRVFTRSDGSAPSLARLGVPPDRVVRLTPGVDTDRFHPRWRDPSVWDRVGVPRDGVKVLYVGRVSVEKNLSLLARAWCGVRRDGRASGARLVVVGDGPWRPEMERRLAGPDVHYLGFRHGDELSRLYASSDLFVFPSLTDTLGQVVMEAQASGLAPIVSDRGGPAALVEDGVTGHVLQGADSAPWAARIGALIGNAGARARMGNAAHASMRGRSTDACFEQFWSVHGAACRRDASRGGTLPP